MLNSWPLTKVKAGPAIHPSVLRCSLDLCDVNLRVPPVPMTIWALGHSGTEKWQTSKQMNFSPLDLQPSRFMFTNSIFSPDRRRPEHNRKHNVKVTLMTYAWLNHHVKCHFLFPKAHIYVWYFKITAIYAMATPPPLTHPPLLPPLKPVNEVSLASQRAHPCVTVSA